MFPDGVASKLFGIMASPPRRRTTVLLVSAVLLAAASGQAAPIQPESTQSEQRQYDSRALSHYLDGDFAMMQGDYAEASAAYERALRYDSRSATIYLALAEALYKQDLLERAGAAGEEARRLQADDPLVYEFLSRNALAREAFGEAVGHLDRWAELDPGKLEPHFRKAGLLQRLEKFDAAVDLYLSIYDRDPRQHQVLPRAGELALSRGDFERAYQAYQRLHVQSPDDHRVTRTYAELCMRTERVEAAVKGYEELEESGGATLATTLQLAWLYVQGKELPRARTMLADLLEQGHRQWDVLNLAGHVAENLSEYDQLAEVATLMTEIYPDSAGGYTRLAIAKNEQDDKAGAVEVLERALPKFPRDPNMGYLLGNLYYGSDRFDDAARVLRAALDRRPETAHIQHLLATTWSSQGLYGPSDSLYEVILATEDRNAGVMNNYAYSLAERPEVSRKQLRRARKLSKAALKREPENAAFLDTYGWIWYRLKWYRTARRYIAKSLDVKPNNPVVLEHLGEVFVKRGRPDVAKTYFARAEQIRQGKTPAMVRAPEE